MKYLSPLFFVIIFSITSCKLPPSKYERDIEIDRVKKNAAFQKPDESPLDSEEMANYKGLFYYQVDKKYCFEASLQKNPIETFLQLPHTLDTSYLYKEVGFINFEYEGKKYSLKAYENDILRKEHLIFVPFSDITNGKTTYQGGRFVEIDMKDAHHVAIDFNKCYFPYCAYSHRFSCPIPPKENALDFAVEAGERYQ
jgi:uncharacterized protein (DUF1684 family)